MQLKIIISILALVVAGIGVAWATGQFASDPQFEEAKKIQEQLQESLVTVMEKPAAEVDKAQHQERREMFQQLREKTEQLEPEQRNVIQEQMQKFFVARMQQQIDEFFELPAEERTAALDEHIDRMESFRTQREQRREERGAEQKKPAAGDAARDADARGGGAGAAISSGRGSRGGRGDWRNASTEQRNEWRKKMLDNTTPEMRAKFTEFRRLMDERREERGLPGFGGLGGR